MADYLRVQRKSRQTGSTISLYDAAHADSVFNVEDGGRWITFCETHELFVQHERFEDAETFFASPYDWCGKCELRKRG